MQIFRKMKNLKNLLRYEFRLKLKAYLKSKNINTGLRIGKGLSLSETFQYMSRYLVGISSYIMHGKSN